MGDVRLLIAGCGSRGEEMDQAGDENQETCRSSQEGTRVLHGLDDRRLPLSSQPGIWLWYTAYRRRLTADETRGMRSPEEVQMDARWSAMAGVCLLGIGLSVVSPAQDPAPQQPAAEQPVVQEPAPAPVVEVPEKAFDFGQIAEGDQAVHVFRIKNAGAGPLKILDVHASCGCTAAVVSEEHKTLEPGQEGEIKVTFNSQGRVGSQHKVVTVNTNDPKTPQVQLAFTVQVRAVLDVQPQTLVFGEACRGLTSEAKEVRLVGVDGQPFVIQSVHQSSDNLVLNWEQTPDGSTVIKVRVSPKDGEASRPVTERVEVQTTHPKKPMVAFTVTWLVVGEIMVTPPQVVLAKRLGQEAAPTRFNVTKRSEGAFAIREVWGLPAYMEQSTETVIPGRQYVVQLRLKDEPPPAVKVQLRVMTDDPKNTNLPVDVQVVSEQKRPDPPPPPQQEQQKPNG